MYLPGEEDAEAPLPLSTISPGSSSLPLLVDNDDTSSS